MSGTPRCVDIDHSPSLDKRTEPLYIPGIVSENGNVQPGKDHIWNFDTAFQPPPFMRNLKSVASAERTRLYLLEL